MKRSARRSRVFLCIVAVTLSFVTGGIIGSARASEKLPITYPRDGAVFPPNFPPPTFRWKVGGTADSWRISVALDKVGSVTATTSTPQWKPTAAEWSIIKNGSVTRDAVVTVSGLASGKENGARGTVRVRTSADPLETPIFYRDVILPVSAVQADPLSTRWRLGYVSSEEAPQVVLQNMKICVNCHSFTPDGKTMGMDVDVFDENRKGVDKGAYILTDVEREVLFSRDKVMSWNDFTSVIRGRSFGLFSQLSPDGRYVVSTVKDMMVFVTFDDNLAFSQLFFPKTGLLGVYDRQTRSVFLLPGASDPAFVQTNATWSPDGKWIVFARAKAVPRDFDNDNFVDGSAAVRFDLFRIPFNGGKGGVAEPIQGASGNGRSNYFPKFTPDGKWIVYTQSEKFMLVQPGAELRIVPAAGGKDRKMACNTDGIMSSWHSIDPSGKWMVFASKPDGPYTQLWLTHLDQQGNDTPPVLLESFLLPQRAANIPEFVNIGRGMLTTIIDKL